MSHRVSYNQVHTCVTRWRVPLFPGPLIEPPARAFESKVVAATLIANCMGQIKVPRVPYLPRVAKVPQCVKVSIVSRRLGGWNPKTLETAPGVH